MSCLDEVMRTIEQLASRQRTELLSLVELHNQQLNDCIRTAKTNLLHNGFDGQRILAERAEKENQLIPAYPISTTIITTSTSTTTQNDTNASKKSTIGDSAPKEKRKRASATTNEVKISANKRENAILQTNLFVSKLPPMKLSKPIMYFTMTPALSTTVKTEKGAPRQRLSKVIDKISTSSGSAAVAGKRSISATISQPNLSSEPNAAMTTKVLSAISMNTSGSSSGVSQVAKRAKTTKTPAASNTLSADYLATLLSWPTRMAGIRRFISEIEDAERRRLLQCGCRQVFLSWMRDLAEQSAGDCEEVWAGNSGSDLENTHILDANLFLETLLVLVDQSPWTDEDIVTSRLDKTIKKVYKKLDELSKNNVDREQFDIKYHPSYCFNGRVDSSNFDILYAMWKKFRCRYKASVSLFRATFGRVIALDDSNEFGSNLSDNGWAVGKTIAYMNSKGSPDSEDLTMDDQGFIFVCAERDNSKSSSSHLSILKYSSEGNATILTAMEEWDLTKDLPAMDPNLGLEGITFILDDFLLSKKFVDEVHGKVYDPNDYPGHGNGLFFVGLEGNGFIYGYALMPNGVYHNICSVSSDETAIMSLEFDVSSGYLWATCDNHCNGRSNVFSISNSSGTFTHIAKYDRPSGMGNYNTEGFAIAPDTR
eukprot:gene25139-33659_t